VPDPASIFKMFWPDAILQRIADETNRYARTLIPPIRVGGPERTKGGSD
jgi:hypothetical protein